MSTNVLSLRPGHGRTVGDGAGRKPDAHNPIRSIFAGDAIVPWC
jgi:hypothetical protein